MLSANLNSRFFLIPFLVTTLALLGTEGSQAVETGCPGGACCVDDAAPGANCTANDRTSVLVGSDNQNDGCFGDTDTPDALSNTSPTTTVGEAWQSAAANPAAGADAEPASI